MKRILCTAAVGLSLFVTASALAGEGYVTRSVSLRAGPDFSYPAVARIRAGASVSIEGCVDGWSWCDVDTGGERGWLAGNYLQEEYEGRRVLVPGYGVQIGIPIVSFVFGSYWDDHYRNRSWYGHRERWSHVRPRYSERGYRSSTYSVPSRTAAPHESYREHDSVTRQAPSIRQERSPARDSRSERDASVSASAYRAAGQPRVVSGQGAPANDAARQGHERPAAVAERRAPAAHASSGATREKAAHERDGARSQGKDNGKDNGKGNGKDNGRDKGNEKDQH